jgi:hypothetical protein
MPPKRVEKKDKTTPVLNNTRNAQKEIAVIESLHKAETHQLTSFIKSRNNELDADIQRLQQKLKLSNTTTSNNDHLNSMTASQNLAVSGKGLGRVSLDTDAISNNRQESIRTDSMRFNLDPSKTRVPTTAAPVTKDHLVLLLARIKLSEFILTSQLRPIIFLSLFRNGRQQRFSG